jgi:hypothetical protein
MNFNLSRIRENIDIFNRMDLVDLNSGKPFSIILAKKQKIGVAALDICSGDLKESERDSLERILERDLRELTSMGAENAVMKFREYGYWT